MITKNREDTFVLRAPDFYRMLEDQDYKCALTGRELTPEVTDCEHIVPLRKGGKHELKNIYLVHRDVSKLKRYLTETEVMALAREIIACRGAEFGIRTLSVTGKKR